MAQCPPELLDDLTDVFAEVRTWAGIIEKKPGVFYARRQPFLHFHLVEGDLARSVSATKRRAFLRELRARHRQK